MNCRRRRTRPRRREPRTPQPIMASSRSQGLTLSIGCYRPSTCSPRRRHSRTGCSGGSIMNTFVFTCSLPKRKSLTGSSRVAARSRRADRSSAPGSGRPSRTSAAAPPTCGRSTCRTSSSARARCALWDAERARQHAVRAGDAARLQRAADDAVLALLDGVRRADQRAGRLVAVHADHRHGGDACSAGRCSRRGSSTAPRWVSHSAQAATQARQPMQRDGSTIELVAEHSDPLSATRHSRHSAVQPVSSSRIGFEIGRRVRSSRCGRPTPCTRGSCCAGRACGASAGSRSAGPGQWYGMKTVSGRIVRTTSPGRPSAARRVVTVTQSPSSMPSFAASADGSPASARGTARPAGRCGASACPTGTG